MDCQRSASKSPNTWIEEQIRDGQHPHPERRRHRARPAHRDHRLALQRRDRREPRARRGRCPAASRRQREADRDHPRAGRVRPAVRRASCRRVEALRRHRRAGRGDSRRHAALRLRLQPVRLGAGARGGRHRRADRIRRAHDRHHRAGRGACRHEGGQQGRGRGARGAGTGQPACVGWTSEHDASPAATGPAERAACRAASRCRRCTSGR